MTTFIHPYNFVRLPKNDLPQFAQGHSLFGRHPFISSEKYFSDRQSGFLECVLTTNSDWFIPHSAKVKVAKHNQHKTLGYFTLDDVDAPRWTIDPINDATKPAIPASSLRGMIRSVFETATLSCFGEFDPGTLDFRFANVLDEVVSAGDLARTGKLSPSFIPVRLRKNENDGFDAEILNGRAGFDPPAVFPYANAPSYFKKVRYKETDPVTNRFVWKSGQPTKLLTSVDSIGIASGSPIAVTIRAQHQNRRSHATRLHYREVFDIVKAEDASLLQPKAGQITVFGYWYRTGPNFTSKHDERVFFSWDAEYNFPQTTFPTAADCLADQRPLNERFSTFDALHKTGTPKPIPIENSVVVAFEESLKAYFDRNRKNATTDPPRKLAFKPQVQVSDFVDRNVPNKINDGTLCYALIEGLNGDQPRIDGLYPVAVPRLNHPDSRGRILWSKSRSFYPCKRTHEFCEKCVRTGNKVDLCAECRDRHQRLCPACRVFGWTREFGTYKPAGSDSNRVDSVSGHLRFTHGQLISWPPNSAEKATSVTLPILDSPKATFTEFYLRSAADWKSIKESRWPPSIQKHNSPLYRVAEAQLRGRKMYRRRANTNPESPNPAEGGLVAPADETGLTGKRGRQNQTVYLLPKDMKFRFRVYFDNLSNAELGALIFSLTLKQPRYWPRQNGEPRHMLGHGKSLGMGSASIEISNVEIENHVQTSPANRYHKFEGFNEKARQPAEEVIKTYFQAFDDAWRDLLQKDMHSIHPMLEDFVDMLTTIPEDQSNPIHYPVRYNANARGQIRHYEIYTWFAAYRANDNRTPFPSPKEERQQTEIRLPINPSDNE